MKMLKLGGILVLLGALVVILQLADPPRDSPAARFRRLPDANFTGMAQAEAAAGHHGAALLLLDYSVATDSASQSEVLSLGHSVFSQMTADDSPAGRLKTTGWTTLSGGGNSFENLAAGTVADSVLYGDIAELSRQGAFDNKQDEFVTALNAVTGIADVFPPAGSAITLVKAARLTAAVNDLLSKQLRHVLSLVQSDPKSSPSVEKFKENFMPVFELSRRCRTWTEFQTILQQANSPDQVKVLTKMVTDADTASRRLSEVLTIAAGEGSVTPSMCLDRIMRRGQRGLDCLYAAACKGGPGLKLAVDYPSLTPQSFTRSKIARDSAIARLQDAYQSLCYQYGAIMSAVKYLLIAVLVGMLMLLVVPGAYLEKLIATMPTESRGGVEPGPIHHLLVALAVGVVLSGIAYVLAMAIRAASVEPVAMMGAEVGAATGAVKVDSGMLSATVVLISLTVHAVIWFFVRSKIRNVEEDATATVALRLKRLENLDVFLDLPLFCGLALTVIAFILITLDAGMSRHFAYASTAVGIVSAVSLRVFYLYPLKEKLIRA